MISHPEAEPGPWLEKNKEVSQVCKRPTSVHRLWLERVDDPGGVEPRANNDNRRPTEGAARGVSAARDVPAFANTQSLVDEVKRPVAGGQRRNGFDREVADTVAAERLDEHVNMAAAVKQRLGELDVRR